VVDAVALTRPVREWLGPLTSCGLGEPMRIRSSTGCPRNDFGPGYAGGFAALSRGGRPLLCDEFERISRCLAKAIAFNLRAGGASVCRW
jgi:hypothetical protein